MVRTIISSFFIAMIVLGLSTVTFAQEKQEMKKDEPKKETKTEMTKTEVAKSPKEMGPLKSISCDDACGFAVKDRDEKELMAIMKSHAKKQHKMDMTDKQIKEMIKTEGTEMHK